MKSLKLSFLWCFAWLILYGKLCNSQIFFFSRGGSAASSAAASAASASSGSAAASAAAASAASGGSGGYPIPPGGTPEHNCIPPEVPICADVSGQDCCPDRCECPPPLYMRRLNDTKCVECNFPPSPPPQPDPIPPKCPKNEIPICVDQLNLKDCCPDRCQCPSSFVRMGSQNGACVEKKITVPPVVPNPGPHEVAICANGDTDCCPDQCRCPEGFLRLSKENGRCVKDCPPNEIPVCADGDRDCCPEQCQCPLPLIRKDGICTKTGSTNTGNCPPNEVPICDASGKYCCPDRCRCPAENGYVRVGGENGPCEKPPPDAGGESECPENEVPICDASGRYCCPDRCRCPAENDYVRIGGENGPCEKPPPDAGGESECPENEVPICDASGRYCCPDRCRCPAEKGYMRVGGENGSCQKATPADSGDDINCPENEAPICDASERYCCPDRCRCPAEKGYVRVSGENGPCQKATPADSGDDINCPENEEPICDASERYCCPDRCRCPSEKGYVRVGGENGPCQKATPAGAGGNPGCPENEVPICDDSGRSCCPDRCMCPGGFARFIDQLGRCERVAITTVSGDIGDEPECPDNEVPICDDSGKYCCPGRCMCPENYVRENCVGKCKPKRYGK